MGGGTWGQEVWALRWGSLTLNLELHSESPQDSPTPYVSTPTNQGNHWRWLGLPSWPFHSKPSL